MFSNTFIFYNARRQCKELMFDAGSDTLHMRQKAISLNFSCCWLSIKHNANGHNALSHTFNVREIETFDSMVHRIIIT